MPRRLRLTRALVSKIPELIPDPGPMPEIEDIQTEEKRNERLRMILATRPTPDQFWVFAFGSLMWRPDFPFVEKRRARILGWQRSFCLGPDTRYRGNPDAPGLMLTLDRGGSCEGVAFRLDEKGLSDCLSGLIEREPPIPPEWVPAITEQGSIQVMAFVCQPGGLGYVGGLSLQETARQIAPAVGMLGSMADYVLNTVSHLEEMGIEDQMVWELQELVAKELEALP